MPQVDEQHDHQIDSQQRPLVTHLIELRQRLLTVIVCVFLLFIPIYYFANEIYLFVADPLLVWLPDSSGMIATEVASPFLTPLKLSFILAAFLTMPFLLYQVWRFIAPGLYLKEKRFVVPMFLSSVLLFYFGMAFAYYTVMPLVFQFTTRVVPEGVAIMTDISRYLEFILKMFFAFGLAFEIPVLVLILVRSGITTTASLSHKRPYIVVGCFTFAMLLTPPDVISQLLLAVPMWLLYEIGLLLSRLLAPKSEY